MCVYRFTKFIRNMCVALLNTEQELRAALDSEGEGFPDTFPDVAPPPAKRTKLEVLSCGVHMC